MWVVESQIKSNNNFQQRLLRKTPLKTSQKLPDVEIRIRECFHSLNLNFIQPAGRGLFFVSVLCRLFMNHESGISSPMGHWGKATLRPRRWGQRQWGQTTLRPDDVEARRRWGQTTLRPGDVEARYVWVTFPNLNIGLNVATLRPMFGLKVATSRPMLSQNLIENFFF